MSDLRGVKFSTGSLPVGQNKNLCHFDYFQGITINQLYGTNKQTGNDFKHHSNEQEHRSLFLRG